MNKSTNLLNIGVIGTGGMGTRHAENIHRYIDRAQVVAVSDMDAGRAAAAAALSGGGRVFADPYAMIVDPQVDAVLIASADASHFDYTLACLRAGKPVLCEKPLSATAADALRVVEAERALGCTLVSVGFCRRFDPQHLAVHRVVQSGALGRPVLYKGVHRNSSVADGTPASTVLLSSAGHDIDGMRWLLGREVREVYASAVRSHPAAHPDTRDLVMLQLMLDGDCLATIEVYVAVEYGYEVTAEVVGERGSVLTLPPDNAEVRLGNQRAARVADDWLERFQEGYVAEVRQWTHAVLTGGAFAGANAWDGWQAVRVTEACAASLASGLPVRL